MNCQDIITHSITWPQAVVIVAIVVAGTWVIVTYIKRIFGW